MKVEEVRKMKDEMEQSIEQQLVNFTRATGLAVTHIGFRMNHQHWDADGKKMVDLVYLIETRVEI